MIKLSKKLNYDLKPEHKNHKGPTTDIVYLAPITVNPRPPGLQSDGAPEWSTEAAS